MTPRSLVLFSSKDCVPCRRVKEFLDDHGTRWAELDQEKDAELFRILGIQNVPVLVLIDGIVEGPDSFSAPLAQVVGFNVPQLRNIIHRLHNG